MKRAASAAFRLGGFLLLGVPAIAEAQPVPKPFSPPPVPRRAPPPVREGGSPSLLAGRGRAVESGWLDGRLGIGAAARLLASESSPDRVRGVERLAGLGQTAAVDRLLAALEPGTVLSRDERARLVAVRVLAPFAGREPVRQFLAKTLGAEGSTTPFASLVRDTAALALAAAGDARSVELLATAVLQGGVAGESARRALVAHPPARLAPLVSGREGVPPAMSALLADLGDLRALEPLRATLSRPKTPALPGVDEHENQAAVAAAPADPTQAIAAAVALARLGDEEQVPVARGWVASGEVALKLAGARVLATSGAADAGRAIAALLAVPAAREEALRLALECPAADEVAPLVAIAKEADGASRTQAIAALGRIGTAPAVAALAAMLADPARGWDAAFALALAPSAEARAALGKALGVPATKRLSARASTVRALVRDDAPSGLADALDALLRSRDPADRGAAAFGLAATGAVSVRTLVASDDPAIVRAAARAALVAGPDAVAACAERLAREKDETTRVALAMALAASPYAADALPTGTLAELADGGGAVAPVAARALGLRDGEAIAPRLARLLASGDPVVRAHAARGLALSPSPDAVSRLVAAYTFETDAAVRRAVVRALSRRTEPQRRRTLELAASLDPDAETRESARLALAGQTIDDGVFAPHGRSPAPRVHVGPYVAFIALASNDPARASAAARAARLVRSDGLALPVVADPDGALLVAGLPPGEATLSLSAPLALAFPPAAEDARTP